MEKIIITCSARHLLYEFPKRKWYQLSKYDRIALMRLPSVKEDGLDADILLRVCEDSAFEMGQSRVWDRTENSKGESDREQLQTLNNKNDYWIYSSWQNEFYGMIHPLYRKIVCQKMFQYFNQLHKHIEHVIFLDFGDELLPDLLYELTQDRNYLTVLSQTPQAYEPVLQQTELDSGLVGMVFTEYREFVRYLKQMKKGMPALVVIGTAQEQLSDKIQNSILYQLPKKSFLIDFSQNEIFCGHIFKKRMNFTYVNPSIFLDNIVKNRYNAVVNEGITFQVINKNVWRRKGNKDGRKEEYSDL